MRKTMLAATLGGFAVLAITAAQAGPAWGPPGWQNGPPDPCGPNGCQAPAPKCHTVYTHECTDYQPREGGGWHCTAYEDVPHQECS
ncbi:MAG: hypothetical protein KGJ75_09965 [Alphaproteobacteria bacterium]|nr:hypothetical protein [Alphaproteobacteria bacterium]MDE2013238.1 hypothetical protein [Alphaproteobacteria bacterium]MDE2075107.1 hypothetical protein [Alphaproteobacteria bacterium]